MNYSFTTLLTLAALKKISGLISVGAVFTLLATPALAQLAEPNEAGITFGHVHVSATDMELHKKLWTDLFDGELVEKEGYTAIELPGVQIFLREQEPSAPSHLTAMDHFSFSVRNIDEILDQWQAMGYEVDESYSEQGDNGAFITMPDGIRLKLEENPALSVKAEMGHVHFISPQYSELPSWYAELFETEPGTEGSTELTSQVPGSGLRFSDSKTERLETEGTAIDHIGFETEDMEGFVKLIEDKEIPIEFGPRYIESLDLWVVFFSDPSGVLVEVTQGLNSF
jgi:catechol 2,3-dioxygenase-like lactoylglutathione lyase family enzyme